MKYKIIVDSSSDLTNDSYKGKDFDFEVVPLSIFIDGKEYVDDDSINVDEMLDNMHAFHGKSTSSCPSSGVFMEACTADVNFIITITDKLSGSYNSAMMAKKMVEEETDKKVFVFNSKLVTGAMVLMVENLIKLINDGLPLDQIVNEEQKYIEKRKLYFVLQSFENFIKNGRVSRLVGLLANVLAIKPICTGVDGEIKIVTKVRGTKLCYKKIVELLKTDVDDIESRTLIINHCKADEDVNKIIELIKENYNFKEIRVMKMRGLCSFYALEKGMIFSY